MTFVVDEEKRRTWNHGWWKSWTQGKVLIALAIIGAVSFLVMLPHHIRCLSEYFTVGHSFDSDGAFTRFFTDVTALITQIAFMGCGVSVYNYRSVPARAFSSEALVIEDGLLRWVRLSNFERDGKPYLVFTVCRIDACSFAVDKKTRMLVVSAGGDGSMGWGLCESPDVALSVPIEGLRAAGETPYPKEIKFYPYFNPDPIQYLRDLGVEVA